MSAKTFPPEMPRLRPQKDGEPEKRAGFIASLLAKLGLGNIGAGSAASPVATVGTGSAFWAGILASKAGIVGLILAGTTGAVGVGVTVMNLGMPARDIPQLGMAFDPAPQAK